MAIESSPTVNIVVEQGDTGVERIEVDTDQVRQDLAKTAQRARMLIEATEPTVHFDASGVRLTERDLQELRENGPEINR